MGKITAVILIIAGILFGFFGGALHILNTGDTHLVGLFGAIIVTLIILFVYITEHGSRQKTVIWISICLAGGAAFAVPHYYKENFEKVSDSEVDLYAYEPLKESEKLARLDQKISFQIVEYTLGDLRIGKNLMERTMKSVLSSDQKTAAAKPCLLNSWKSRK